MRNMQKHISAELRNDIEMFIKLMIEKGDPSAMRDVLKLKRALVVESPVLDTRVKITAENALTPNIVTYEMTREERALIGNVINATKLWREGKPGPPKEFPVRLDLRIADTDRDALISIAKQTGEGHSEIIRRLIRESNNQ